ncbi:SIS domain-containing protein [Candidatus Thioglobus sp.]|jgi:D-sedoheptulose 7-phosphate isomerase|nr:SIS domain-containing protein [Candidatus Thioglobus sp.]
MKFYHEYFSNIANCISSVEQDPLTLSTTTQMLHQTRERGGKVILVGNGGSAAMASHVSVDLVKVSGLRAVNFNEADLITCFANDYGYEHWVEKALEFYADPNDLIVLISSSGKSANILNGAIKAKQMKLALITFSGFAADNPLRKLGDINFWANSQAYNVVEMTHHVWLLALVDKLVADRDN